MAMLHKFLLPVLAGCLFLASLIAPLTAKTQDAENVGVTVPDGFTIEKVADDQIATNIFCMATDPDGEVYVSGPGYVARLIDSNGDGSADGQPTKVMSIKTGGEHDAHAIRLGSDGWFYLLAGNGTVILPEYFAGKYSPVKDPRAGFLMRISPDFKSKEIVAHGFRNAYDFDISQSGEIFVFDSDGERDISLPWYRPTRVFKIRPGAA